MRTQILETVKKVRDTYFRNCEEIGGEIYILMSQTYNHASSPLKSRVIEVLVKPNAVLILPSLSYYFFHPDYESNIDLLTCLVAKPPKRDLDEDLEGNASDTESMKDYAAWAKEAKMDLGINFLRNPFTTPLQKIAPEHKSDFKKHLAAAKEVRDTSVRTQVPCIRIKIRDQESEEWHETDILQDMEIDDNGNDNDFEESDGESEGLAEAAANIS